MTFLLWMADGFAARGFSSSAFVLRMSREEIGSYVGLTLETVSRQYSRLAEIGRLIDDRSYPEAKKLAQSLLGDASLSAEYRQQAEALIQRADEELKKVWAGATISEPEHEIEKKERRNRNQ